MILSSNNENVSFSTISRLGQSKNRLLKVANEEMIFNEGHSQRFLCSTTPTMIRLSPYHEIFYNEWKLNPQRSDYNIVVDHNLWGEFDPERLKQALQRLSRDYFLLQSHIIETAEGYYWKAQPGLSIAFEYIETPQNEAELLAYAKAPFNLRTGPLMRVRLIKLEEGVFRLIIVIHHLIMDGAKVSFISEKVPCYYNDPQHRFDLSLAKQCEKLADLSQHLIIELAAKNESHTKFWRDKLTDLAGADLRFLKSDRITSESPLLSNPIGEYLFSIDQAVAEQLQVIKKRYCITPYLLSQAVFALLLHRYTGQDRFALCYLVAISEGMEFIYGAHVSPVIIAYEFSDEMRIIDVLEHAKNSVKEIKNGKHHYFPIQSILADFLHNNLLTASFTQTDLKDRLLHFEGILKTSVNTNLNVDCAGKLLFAQEHRADTYNYRVMYARKDIDTVLLETFVKNYQVLLAEISADLIDHKTEKCLSDYWKTTPDPSQYIFPELNAPYTAYSTQQTLHQLFEVQAFKTPDQVALVYENTRLTYRELNESANRLAHRLRNIHAIQPDDLISLCLNRDHKMVVAILAVLKSGAAYVPIDPSYPDKRIQYLSNDTQSKCILTNQSLETRLSALTFPYKNSLIVIDTEQSDSVLDAQSIHNPTVATTPANLAYVIYTSGTTGHPKGVMIEHSNVVNLVQMQADKFQLSTTETSLHCLGFAPYVFDAHVWEFFVTLCNGHCLHLVSDSIRQDLKQLSGYIKSQKIDLATLPPVLLDKSLPLPLKTLIIAGETAEQSVVEQYLANGVQIINAYGPTEATVCATFHRYRKGDIVSNIGKPITNASVYVLDHQRNLLPHSAVGELYVGGAGIARGYLNKPALTAERFIPNPFQTNIEKQHQRNARLYKTGDLVRWLPNGDIEYLGRTDDQIKIRGMRVEFAEIEDQLERFPNIEHVLVTNQAGTKKLLLAYYVSPTPIEQSELHSYLASRLPAYMLPHAFIHLDALPVTRNGKLDKTALPQPILPKTQSFIAPRNPMEGVVCAAFASVLGLSEKEVGIHQDFFELGGDSVRAIQLAVKLGCYLKIDVGQIFELKTPEKLVEHLPAVANNLDAHIEHIKAMYLNTVPFTLQDWSVKEQSRLKDRLDRYRQNVSSLTFCKKKKNITTVLLTGATGHLGCNMLKKLLSETDYHLFLLIREDSRTSACERLNHKFRYYFGCDLLHQYQHRVTVFVGNIEKPTFDLSTHDYDRLAKQVDSVIHCAALIKHQGNYEEFYRANVQATRYLLEFTKLTRMRDFHYVSTVSVLLTGYVPGENEYLFNEEDEASKLVLGENYYVRTKYQAETLVREYREEGIQSSIYRVGNLGMHSVTGITQENSQDNLFFNHFKTMLQVGIIPSEIAKLELSPVDCTALAVVKLFDKVDTNNSVYHVFNPYPCDFTDLLGYFSNLTLRRGSLDEFVDKVLTLVQTNSSSQNAHLLLVYQLWLKEAHNIYSTRIRVSQERTGACLSQLDFSWPRITPVMLNDFVKKAAIFNDNSC